MTHVKEMARTVAPVRAQALTNIAEGEQLMETTLAPLNNRDEPQFEGLRHYDCHAEACSSFSSGHDVEWDEPMRHTAYASHGDDWNVAVQWWPQEEAWTVSGEYRDPDCGHLNRHESVRFIKALSLAHAFADVLNVIKSDR